MSQQYWDKLMNKYDRLKLIQNHFENSFEQCLFSNAEEVGLRLLHSELTPEETDIFYDSDRSWFAVAGAVHEFSASWVLTNGFDTFHVYAGEGVQEFLSKV